MRQFLFVLLVLILGLAGCGGGGSSSDGTPSADNGGNDSGVSPTAIDIVGSWNYTITSSSCPGLSENGTYQWTYAAGGYGLNFETTNLVDFGSCRSLGTASCSDPGPYPAPRPINESGFSAGMNSWDCGGNTTFSSTNFVSSDSIQFIGNISGITLNFSLNREGGSGGGSTDTTTDTGFAISSTPIAFRSDYNQVCVSELGSDWVQADWTDVQDYYSSGGALEALVSEVGFDIYPNAWVSKDGITSLSSTRDYFISYHNHNVPSGYAQHANIDNSFFSLGSWGDSRPVLCRNSGGAPQPIITTVTISWDGAVPGVIIGGLDLIIDYNQTKVSNPIITNGTLTNEWIIVSNDDGDIVNSGLIGTTYFDGGKTAGSVLTINFNVVSGLPSIADFFIDEISYVDENFNTVFLTNSDVKISISNN